MTPEPHILIAEDDNDDFFLLAREMLKAGFTRLARVADGKAALHYLEGKGEFRNRAKHPFPDVVFLDLKMPELRGDEVLRAIRAHPDWKKLRVFIQTGSNETRDRELVSGLGASGYFVKPVRAADVTAALSA